MRTGQEFSVPLADWILRKEREGGRFGAAQARARYERLSQERVEVILEVLAGLGGRAFAKTIYGRFVQESAIRGWPIIGYSRFMQLLRSIKRCPCGAGHVRLEARSFGRAGRVSIVELVRIEPVKPSPQTFRIAGGPLHV